MAHESSKKDKSDNRVINSNSAMGDSIGSMIYSPGITFTPASSQKRIVVVTFPRNSMTSDERDKLEEDFNAQGIEVVMIQFAPNSAQPPRCEFIYN